MQNEKQPINVYLAEGQNEVVIRNGEAPKQLDQLAPKRIELNGALDAPLRFLEKRVGDIDQHKACVIVNRDKLTVTLIINEDDAYLRGVVQGQIRLTDSYKQLGINDSDLAWQPEQLGQFLKLHRTFFCSAEENRRVVSALKSLNANVTQSIERDSKENGNRTANFRQVVESNIPEKFTLKIPIFVGSEPAEIEVETYAVVDGQDISVSLISAGAVGMLEDAKIRMFDEIVASIKTIAPEIVIIEQ